MNNLTERIMSVLALEERETLPKGWWMASCFVERCSACHSNKGVETIDLGYGDKRRVCEACGVDIYCDEDTYYVDENITPPRYIGPDLTDPRNLHALLLVCDAVDIGSVDLCQAGEGFVCWLYTDISTEYSGTGPDRTTAALDALCKALGVEKHGNELKSADGAEDVQ